MFDRLHVSDLLKIFLWLSHIVHSHSPGTLVIFSQVVMTWSSHFSVPPGWILKAYGLLWHLEEIFKIENPAKIMTFPSVSSVRSIYAAIYCKSIILSGFDWLSDLNVSLCICLEKHMDAWNKVMFVWRASELKEMSTIFKLRRWQLQSCYSNTTEHKVKNSLKNVLFTVHCLHHHILEWITRFIRAKP